MAPSDPASLSSADVTATAIHLLAQQGYDSTSVDELADVLDVSRSTFFRRFGTKEEIVFADHTYLLERLGGVLADSEGDAFDAVNKACLTVIRYHVSRPEATLERRALLRSNPSLRERELVMAHRYERIFRAHLNAHLVDDESRGWMPSAYAAASVAVHNDALRTWFAEQKTDAVKHLQGELGDLADSFRRRVTAGAEVPARAGSRVVVAAFESDAAAETVLASIRRALDG
ncbi:TetR/AcrR family transcriptional regulator [Subtercola endophyticus]|uniref:TetR/AcrR family transcriptional regulator n=1 Tax=Subtercola endophyticus TaxID=2895559 RepID=UPI001E4100BE|nr:TetR/AcrR family transcriptional regulator [Subtercola endophyticus]UFS57521.1 TetR/AcrR family transcriptional regulator [Subtercola endophyticus]